MSDLSLESNLDAIPQEPEKEQKESGKPREWKPTVRMQKREQKTRTKLRIRDLYPDKQYIKEVNGKELRYFLLLIIPVIITAIFTAIQREDLYNRLVEILVKVLGKS
ncbi:MAG TPA: hypothetical protein PLD55_14650 [bacterium]|nr:hypothetical protein [bacterium]HQM85915.1 hypothetical protein [bacterium]